MPEPIVHALRYCQHQGWRLPLWLEGDYDFVISALCQILNVLSPNLTAEQHRYLSQQRRLLLLGEPLTELTSLPLQIQPLTGPARQAVLGHEADILLVNGFSGVDWEMVAASSGAITAGGLWILITPPRAEWLQQANAAAAKLLSFPQSTTTNQFLHFLLPHLNQAIVWSEASIHSENPKLRLAMTPVALSEASTSQWSISTYVLATDAQSTKRNSRILPTAEQADAIAAIKKVVTGHRRRPLVLTAHRGRGKSATLGMAAAELLHAGKRRIVICGPHPAAVAVAQQQFEVMTEGKQLDFWPIDQLLSVQPAVDLLLVDEAAALPIPLLQQLTVHYPRIVFATTEHGYEGTGRGFSLKFQQYLTENCRGWRKLHLHEPIRYRSGDPLEQLIFQAFLLDNDLDSAPSISTTADTAVNSGLQFKAIDLSMLSQQPELLRQVFGLLRFAHYQTSLRDLWALFEDQSLRLFVFEHQKQVIAAALIGIEGQFSAELSQDIAHGKRRVQGHLSAQSFAFHLAAPVLSQLKIARVQRIVVHPELQQRGIGRLMLAQLSQRLQASGIELITTSFGAAPDLVKFWQQAGYAPVRLSQKIEQSSNAPSVLMVKTLQSQSHPLLIEIIGCFGQQLYWQQKQECNLPIDLLKMWLAPPQQPLSPHQIQQLINALHQQKPLTVLPLLEMWLNNHYRNTQAAVVDDLIAIFWQNMSSHEVTKHLNTQLTLLCQTILQTLRLPD